MKEAEESMYSHLDDLATIMQSQINEKQKNLMSALTLEHDLFYKFGGPVIGGGGYLIEARNQISDEIFEVNLPHMSLNGKQYITIMPLLIRSKH